jgi:uncharacterized membrane protein YuzA (DUF378 family)
MRLSACFYSQDLYLASQNRTKIYQKCIRPRVRAVLTKQIFSIPKAFPAGHTGSMSKGNAAGMGKICPSKPTWFDSRTATIQIYNRRKNYMMPIVDRIALIVAAIGGLNWGSVGLFGFDAVAWLFGGQGAVLSRIVYVAVALAALWCISLVFRVRDTFEQPETDM